MDFAFVGPVFSDQQHQTAKRVGHKSQKRSRHKSHSKSISPRLDVAGKYGINNLKYIAAKYDNLYKTSYYINLIPKNDKWIDSPFQIPKHITPSITNHNKILDSFKIPDNKHIYSSDIQQCLDLFNSLRCNNNNNKNQWQLKEEKQELAIYSHFKYKNIIKSHIILPFATAILAGIILNIQQHRIKWDKQFESEQFIKRYSMFTHISYQQYHEFDQVLLNFIYPLSDGSIIIGSKTIKHEQYPCSASSSRAYSNIHSFWHIIPNFNKYDHETDYNNNDYLHSSIVTYYNHIEIESNHIDIDIDEYLMNDSQCILRLKHYIKSISHTLHRPGILHIPPFPMLQMLGIDGIYIGRNKRNHRNRGNASHSLTRSLSHSLTPSLNHQIETRKMSFIYANNHQHHDDIDTLLFHRFNQKQYRQSNKMPINGKINLLYNTLIFTRQDWIQGKRFRLNDVEISISMIQRTDNDDYKDSDISDDEYGIKRKKNIMLSFQNGASCITLAKMAVSELLQETHSCSISNWNQIDMKTPSGLSIYGHINNNNNNKYNDDYYHHMGCATINCQPQYIFDLLCDPLFRFSYDILVDTVQLIEKLDDNTYILRLLHTNKQCFLKTQRETIIVITHRVLIAGDKFILSAVSIEHPAYPTENSNYRGDNDDNNNNKRKQSEAISKGSSISMNSGFIRTDIRSSGWIIERDTKNKYRSRVTYIMNVDFGGNVPSSIKRTVARKQPLAIYNLAKALRQKQQI